MEGPLLRDEAEYPSDDVLARYLGSAKATWDVFAARLAADFPEASLEWRFYKDGKSWLGKVQQRKKTVCWVSIGDQAFRTTFYFTARSDPELDRLPIAQELRSRYLAQPPIGKLKPITVVVSCTSELADVFTLFEYKSGAK